MIHHPQRWLLVFDTTGLVRYHARHFKQANKTLFYFTNVSQHPQFAIPHLKNTPISHITLKRWHRQLVLALDFRRPVVVKSFVLKPLAQYGDRFVVDVRDDVSVKTAKRPLRPVMVVIDPGHGGKDPGATGIHGAHEKNIVLAIAKDLQKNINQTPGFKAILTRNTDQFIPLRGRLTIAREAKGDMFIAIHADAYRNHSAAGVSVYALSQRGASSEAAAWLAARENQSELMGGIQLSNKGSLLRSVLIHLSQIATVRASLQIGSDLIQHIHHLAHLHHDRVEQAAFVVLKSPDIPSLLVETGFISNPKEEHRLVSPRYQHTLAKAIAGGIIEYFRHKPPRHTWLSEHHKQGHV